MKIGICRSADDFEGIKTGKAAGADFLEVSFDELGDYDEAKAAFCKGKYDEIGIECFSAKNFIPSSYKIVGGAVDYAALAAYLEKGFGIANILGIKVVVFGSGGARSADDVTFDEAYSQLVNFTRDYVSPIAAKYGMIVVFEPLKASETKLIHTVKDGVTAAGDVNCANVSALADLYHMVQNGDEISNITAFKGEVLHSHIREPFERTFPVDTDSAESKAYYKSFFKALMSAECKTCAIESRAADYCEVIAPSIKYLKSLVKECEKEL